MTIPFLLPSPGPGGGDSVLHHTLVSAVAGIPGRIEVRPLSGGGDVVGDQGVEGRNGVVVGVEKECLEVVVRRRVDGGGRRLFGEEVLEDDPRGGSAVGVRGNADFIPDLFDGAGI